MNGAWRLAARNLSRNRRRNLVTGSAIALGYAGLLLLGGYSIRMERLMRTGSVYLERFGHLAVYTRGGLEKAKAKPAAYALSREAQDAIVSALRADPRVEIVERFLRGEGLAGNGCRTFPFDGLGVELDVERRLRSHPEVLAAAASLARPVAGRSLPDAAGEESPVSFSVGLGRHRLLKEPAKGPGDVAATPAALDCSSPGVAARIGADPYVQLAGRALDGTFAAVDVRVVGLFQAATTDQDRSGLVAPLDLLQRLYGTDRATYVAAWLRDFRDTPAVVRDARAALASLGLDVSIHSYDDARANPYYVGTVGLIDAVVGFIGLLLASVVTLSVLNAMTLAILERTREIGTLRSIGFTRRQLLGVFLREASALAAIGVSAGLALALGAALAVRAGRVEFQPPGVGGNIRLDLMPSAAICAGAAALFLVLSLAATWLAVRRRVKERIASLVVEVAA